MKLKILILLLMLALWSFQYDIHTDLRFVTPPWISPRYPLNSKDSFQSFNFLKKENSESEIHIQCKSMQRITC